MLQLTFLFVGAVATVATALTLWTTDDQLGILTGLIGSIAWPLWSYSALNVVTVSAGSEFAYQYPALAVFGVLMAVPNLFVALTGPLRVANNRELAQEIQ